MNDDTKEGTGCYGFIVFAVIILLLIHYCTREDPAVIMDNSIESVYESTGPNDSFWEENGQ